MKRKTALVLAALTIFIVVCDKHVAKRKSNHLATLQNDLEPNDPLAHNREKRSEPNEPKEGVKSEEPLHKARHNREHFKERQKKGAKKKGRCKRQTQMYYKPYQNMPIYVPNQQNFVAPNYVPPQYVVPGYYSPRCRNYCYPCVTSTCRRRCPNYPGVTVTTTATTNGSTRTAATITVVPKEPCNCDKVGSVHQECDNTGACLCKPNYSGINCSSCIDGYWKNLNKECIACTCNKYGTLYNNNYCDKKTGRCYCKDGVWGNNCDVCQPNHYGRIEEGCKACDCNRDGSVHQQCDNTGACLCKPNYTGSKCNTCTNGHWKNQNKECIPCPCNKYGSISNNNYCDTETGRCHCKDGVGGDNCDVCKPNHYGRIEEGCKACDPCDKKGHICDPKNGTCVCPPLTTGEECQYCVDLAWGYDPERGCKPCSCSKTGSAKCDSNGGCTCNLGYEGEKCDRCSFGYHGYPTCKNCNCEHSGTVKEDCRDDDCRCGNDGRCRCKENVQGTKCDACKPHTFGLIDENPKGCSQCFCFGRSNKCVEARLNWEQIRTDKKVKLEAVGSDYWNLPKRFTGDLTAFYGGRLTVDMMEGYFIVKVEGNGVILQASSSYNQKIQFLEKNWNILARNSKFPNNCQSELTRPCFMVVLQNVTSIKVEANNGIRDVVLDKGAPNGSSPSGWVEKCECPKEYTGLSCQDPNVGYFRYYPNSPENNWVDMIVGKAKPCECNGKSQMCDVDTGFCKNCTGNTNGEHCELCNTGYYKDNDGNCSSCLCPTASQNHAHSCTPIENSFKCSCIKGYKGQFCDKCDDGYFDKDPSINSVTCEPCNCNPFGVIEAEKGTCNELGICQCKDGFKGAKCDECVNEREVIKDGICTPCDECTKLLFAEIDNLTLAVNDTFDLFKGGVSPPWNILTNTVDKHHMLSEQFKRKKEQTEKLLKNANLDQYNDKINDMQDKLKRENEMADKNIELTNELQTVSDTVADEIEDLKTKLIDIIENLDNSVTRPVDLENALKRATDILTHIKDISKKFDKRKDQESFTFCTNVSQKINEIYKHPLNIPNELLTALKNKLDDLTNITGTVENMTKKAERKNLENVERIKKLKELIEELNKNDTEAKESVKDLMSKINATDHLLDKLEIVYNDLRNITDFMEYKQLEHRIRRQMEGNPKVKELVLKAIEHVQDLETTINSYRSMFNFTKDEWKKINASGAYEELLKGIEEAQNNVELSKKILEDAAKLINPSDSDNIVDKTNIALEYSKGLKKRVDNLRNISKSLNDIKINLDQFKYSLLENGKANNDLNQILNKIGNDITSQTDRVSKLEEAMANSTTTSEDMEEIEKNIQNMLSSSQDNIFSKYKDFLNLTSKEEIEKLKTKINNTRKHLESLNINSTNFDTIKNFNTENRDRNLQSIQAKIESLRNKIFYAKQAADTISIAMNITDCRMTYQLPQVEIFQSLSITFKCETCQLFKLSNIDDNLNLAVNKNDITLKINSKNILISNTGDNKEKTVNIEKLGSLIKMQVDTIEKSVVTDSSYYFIYPNDKIEIGNLNSKPNTKSYIHNVVLNGKKFGLWKFSQTEGNCTGETRDETDKQTENIKKYFNGKGYTIYGKNSELNPAQATLGFDFSTFDENSLIYLATFEENNVLPTEDNCAYMALFLKNGYLNLIVRHSNGENSTLILNNKYNNGREYHVQINMEYERSGVQHYNLFAKNETFDDRTNNTKLLSKKNVFKIKQAIHYVGGIPPTFNKTCLPVNITSFLGFLQLSSRLTNENLSYGITPTNKQILEFYQVRVHKKGFVKVKATEKTVNDLSFILRPTSPKGIIMQLGQYKIYLNNFRLGINGDEENESAISLDKNDYNTVNLSFKEGTLTINRNKEKLQLPKQIPIEDSIITIGDENDGFGGGLSNILVNNRELLFTPNNVLEFAKAEIGRESPPTKSRINIKAGKSLAPYLTNLTNSSDKRHSGRNIERCAKSMDYETISDTIKFGDQSNSYIHVKSNFWKSDYQLDFQIRTFSQDGVIFISIGSQKQPHYNLLRLTDGQLGFYTKGRKNKAPIVLNGKINDGQWHRVQLSKKMRKLTIIVDQKQKKTFKIPKTVVKNEIHFGGVPASSDYSNVIDLKDYLGPLRGCMKCLKINEENLSDNDIVVHSNTRQCFSNIEEGSYFDGNAFAVFNENFKINKMLELSFEFKTTQQNAILLSVFKNEKSPALSVELQRGAILVTLDMGNGIVSNFTYDLISNIALCNNKWHNITATYSNSEMTVNVDGVRKIWVQSDKDTLLNEIDAPMFVGGIPGDAPIGTLKSRKNFKGCIRKLKIENVLVNWYDIREPNNVLLNSCPI